MRERRLAIERLEPRQLLTTDLVISEFLASNHNGLKDLDGDASDWIEIYNTTSASVNLGGWFLTDKASNLTKWQIPSVSIPAHGFQVVFADSKNLAVAGSELHTNFSLDADGEYLALIRPDHSIATEFNPTFLAQTTDVSYGGTFTVGQTSLIGLNATAKAIVPTSANNAALGTVWRTTGFNDSSWGSGTTGVGFDTDTNPATTYSGLIHLNVQSQMLNQNGSVYIRVPFNVANPSTFQSVTLRMKYDDGYVAWINGTQIAAKANPATLAWNSLATANRVESQAFAYEDVTFTLPANVLVVGTNMLAIQGLNFTTNSPDLLIQPELLGNTITYDPSSLGYYTAPTPGAVNNASVQGIVADPTFDHDHGFYSAPFPVVLTSDTASANIRYTTDGSTPTATTGTAYSGPITISATTTLRAVAYRTGFAASAVMTETYVFLSDVVNQSPSNTPPGPGWPADRAISNQKMDYGMDPDIVNSPIWGPQLQAALTAIPTISIVTDLPNLFDPTTGIYVNAGSDTITWERPTSVELINPDGADGFQINAGLRIRGGFSRTDDNPKHAFRLFFRSEYGDSKLNYPLFGDEGADSFDSIDLRTAQNYSWSFQNDGRMTLVNDTFSRDTQRDMGEPYERGSFYQLYLNGQYWGIYETDERPEAAYAETYFGGDKSDYDVIKVSPDNGYTIGATDGVDPRNPDGSDNPNSAWTQLYSLANQIAATTDPTARFALYQKAQGLNPDYSQSSTFPVLLDVNNLADYMLTIFYGGNLDAPISAFLSNNSPNNWFGVRSRDPAARQGFQFFAHDSEHTLLNVNETRMGPYNAGSASSGGVSKSNPQWIHQQLMAEPAYRAAFNLRVNQMLRNGGPLTSASALARDQALAAQLSSAIIAESARWGDVFKTAGQAPFTKDTWQSAINTVNSSFIPSRTNIVLSQLQNAQRDSGGGVLVLAPLYDPTTPLAPVMSIPQGQIVPGTSLSMTNPSGVGTIYYTIDGTDPMLPGGNVAAGALAYSGTLTLNNTVHIFARVKNGTKWSDYTERVYATDTSSLRITEINYNPTPPAVGSPYVADDFEFVELQNTGTSPIDLLEVSFTKGISYQFAGGTLAPGQFAVLASNPTALLTRYPTLNIAGTFTGQLSDGGETLRLEDALGTAILEFEYKDTWFDITDGGGYTLVTNNASAAAAQWAQRDNWRVSQFTLGNPGAADVGLPLNAVIINEVLSNTTAAIGDWIELRNTTAAPINVGGWYLSNNKLILNKFRIPAGTTIAAGGYLLYNARDNFNNAANPNSLSQFTLSEVDDKVLLTSVDGAGNFAGYRDDADFLGAAPEVSFGRYIKSTGQMDFVAMTTATPGAANAAPIVGPIVINELMYHPVQGGDEFIEIYNTSGATVSLFDPARPNNTWSFNDGVVFSFPTGQTLAANSYALVVPIDPATFRTKYGISASVAIYGPFTGALANEGEKVRLSRPGVPAGSTVPQISVDHVDFETASPWPVEPGQGGGRTLSRVVSANYGNDVANWRASAANGGTPAAVNIVVAPTFSINDVSIVEGDSGSANLVFTVTLSGISTQQITVNYATANGTASAGSDYTSTSGILTFTPGATSMPISVPILGDRLKEFNEQFTVNLSNPINATIADSQGLGTIQDNDPQPSLSVGNVSVTEGNAGATTLAFDVTLSAASGQTVTVNYSTSNGTATAGADYTTASGTLTFTPGQTTRPVSITVQGETTFEPDETLTLTLSNPTAATLAASSATGTILNDDPLPTITIGDVSFNEGDSGTANAVFTVVLSNPSAQQISVSYSTADGTATAGSDYVATSNIRIFAAGATSAQINVPVVGEVLYEGDETFFVNLSNALGASIVDSQAIGTIVNNDPVPPIPTATVTPLDPNIVTAGPNQLTIVWDEAVSGFTIASLSLTRGAGPNLLTPAQTLTTSDNITFTLNNLSSLDVLGGNYTLKFTAAGSNVVNDSNRPPVADASSAFTVLPVAPEVNAVYVSSTAWQQSFLAYLANNNLGDSQLGYRLTGGASQLESLPWKNINVVSVVFSRDVNIDTTNLALVGSSDLPAAPALGGATFSYDSTTHVAKWVYHSGLPVNKYLLSIPTASVTSVASGQALDGEFANGSALLPSGDAVAGGNFNFRFNILPGDVDQDGFVTGLDGSTVRQHFMQFATTAGYNPLLDTYGKGAVTGIDALTVQAALLTQLPATDPIAPGGGGSGVALAALAPPTTPLAAISAAQAAQAATIAAGDSTTTSSTASAVSTATAAARSVSPVSAPNGPAIPVPPAKPAVSALLPPLASVNSAVHEAIFAAIGNGLPSKLVPMAASVTSLNSLALSPARHGWMHAHDAIFARLDAPPMAKVSTSRKGHKATR